jgi:hypothetical protein
LIYPDELEIKDTTESDKSASYLDSSLNIDSNDRLTTSLYDKRDDFDFAIVNNRGEADQTVHAWIKIKWEY